MPGFRIPDSICSFVPRSRFQPLQPQQLRFAKVRVSYFHGMIKALTEDPEADDSLLGITKAPQELRSHLLKMSNTVLTNKGVFVQLQGLDEWLLLQTTVQMSEQSRVWYKLHMSLILSKGPEMTEILKDKDGMKTITELLKQQSNSSTVPSGSDIKPEDEENSKKKIVTTVSFGEILSYASVRELQNLQSQPQCKFDPAEGDVSFEDLPDLVLKPEFFVMPVLAPLFSLIETTLFSAAMGSAAIAAYAQLKVDVAQRSPVVKCNGIPEALRQPLAMPFAGKVSLIRNSVDSYPLLTLTSGDHDDDEADAISLTVYVTGESSHKVLSAEKLIPAWCCKGAVAGATMAIERTLLRVNVSDFKPVCHAVLKSSDVNVDEDAAETGSHLEDALFQISVPSLKAHDDLTAKDGEEWELSRPVGRKPTVPKEMNTNTTRSKTTTLGSCFDIRPSLTETPSDSNQNQKARKLAANVMRECGHLLR